MHEDTEKAGAKARERGEGADIRGRDTQKKMEACPGMTGGSRCCHHVYTSASGFNSTYFVAWVLLVLIFDFWVCPCSILVGIKYPDNVGEKGPRWLTILGYSPLLQEIQGRNLKYDICSQELRE